MKELAILLATLDPVCPILALHTGEGAVCNNHLAYNCHEKLTFVDLYFRSAVSNFRSCCAEEVQRKSNLEDDINILTGLTF